MPATAKICGLTTPETIDAAIKGGASHIGLNFFPPSPRHVEIDQVRALAARMPSHVQAVGVFVDPDERLVADAMQAAGLSVIQLHGSESPDRVAELKRLTGLETWKVLSIRTRADLERARDYRGAVDLLLYDAKTPPGSALPGGMGLRFDWTLLDGFDHPLPWGLSGGLEPGNVADAIHRTATRMVDVSSGVETAPGVKDPELIRAFLRAVEAA
ncbi:phosphoribosylanthranilate isomerase [Sphingomonas sp.]|jgi:phosphoribosylanthranilate isomerase|uniref:phosphoribosylanthranilate isomerase n=1 Tax=Sphingomonas sp. TaxID=28214 RepID=UPI002D7F3CBE|nr:phosphoribosylanthranilate isomerase [Sphingomonas sp.]HEU0045113.1 phosphoribosylanthranilate isomerase [Sphingomonas sp.]